MPASDFPKIRNIFFLKDKNFKINPVPVGNKAAKLADMSRMGIQIPSGFVITTEVGKHFRTNAALGEGHRKDIMKAVSAIEKNTGRNFASTDNPLIFSVRSGSMYSMPGMMDTILNVGISEEVLIGLSEKYGEKTGLDCYRRLLQMFGITVYGIDANSFEEILSDERNKANVNFDCEMSEDVLKKVVTRFKNLIKKVTGEPFPNDPYDQLFLAIGGVFNSWENPGPKSYRQYSGIPDDVGTAVTIQEMKFGNRINSGSGVMFTRNPRTGESSPYVEFLEESQGEDIVGGLKKPIALRYIPENFKLQFSELFEIGRKLEKHYQCPQDIEFTIEDGALWLLQTRSLKLSSEAALKIATEMLAEGLISKYEAVRIIRPDHISHLLTGQISDEGSQIPITVGISASVGAVCGRLALSITSVEKYFAEAVPCVFIANHIDPNDVDTLLKTSGVVTTMGGAASHMAIIMRSAAKPGIVGCQDITISKDFRSITIGEVKLTEGDYITIDGSSGNIYCGQINTRKAFEPTEQEKYIIDLKNELLGRSPWSAACYKVNKKFGRSEILKKLEEVQSALHWKSAKAQVIEILNVMITDQNEIIPYTIFLPSDKENIRMKMLENIAGGEWVTVRTGHFPEKLSGSPWAGCIKDSEQIDTFLEGDFPGKYGGYKQWILDPDLDTLFVGKNPEYKMDPAHEKEHFVYTVSMLDSFPPKVVVSINLNTFHLRTFERTGYDDLVMLTCTINQDSPLHIGDISLRIGPGHIRKDIRESALKDAALSIYCNKFKEDITLARELANGVNKREISPEYYDKILDQDVFSVMNALKQKVFNTWWNQPIVLPHLMCALDDKIGLSVLEGQGRIVNHNVVWCKIYGAKGGEERVKIKRAKESN